MKRLIIYLIIMAICSLNIGITSAEGEKYAKITDYNTYIYKTPSLIDNYQNKICLVEPTYFVKVLSVGSNYFEVEYNGITGFIDKTNVHLSNFTPVTPYPNGISIITGDICNLRSTPEIKPLNAIVSIPKHTTTLGYIGRIYGEEAMDFGGNTWYYVKYNNQYGYIYNKYIDSISSIFKNTENVTSENNLIDSIKPLTNSDIIVIVSTLSIPFIIILCVLYFPTKYRVKSHIKHKE